MKAQEKELIDKLIEDAASVSFRETTLQIGVAAFQRKRRRRGVYRAAAMAMAMVGIIVGERKSPQPATRANLAVEPAAIIPGTSVHLLKDEELLAFFKGRPVALFGEPGNQRLVVFEEKSGN